MKEFSEIATTETIKKARVISKQKNRDDYSPEKDFYKILRDHIQTMHKNERDVEYLENAPRATTHTARKEHYNIMISQYKKWIKKKKIEYFQPPRDAYTTSNTHIIANPELGLEINGVPHVVKLFLHKDKLTQVRANFMLAIMDCLWPEKNNVILDVRNKKEFKFSGNAANYIQAINAEVASIESIWTNS
jgi:hypothetical protein